MPRPSHTAYRGSRHTWPDDGPMQGDAPTAIDGGGPVCQMCGADDTRLDALPGDASGDVYCPTHHREGLEGEGFDALVASLGPVAHVTTAKSFADYAPRKAA